MSSAWCTCPLVNTSLSLQDLGNAITAYLSLTLLPHQIELPLAFQIVIHQALLVVTLPVFLVEILPLLHPPLVEIFPLLHPPLVEMPQLLHLPLVETLLSHPQQATSEEIQVVNLYTSHHLPLILSAQILQEQ